MKDLSATGNRRAIANPGRVMPGYCTWPRKNDRIVLTDDSRKVRMRGYRTHVAARPAIARPLTGISESLCVIILTALETRELLINRGRVNPRCAPNAASFVRSVHLTAAMHKSTYR